MEDIIKELEERVSYNPISGQTNTKFANLDATTRVWIYELCKLMEEKLDEVRSTLNK